MRFNFNVTYHLSNNDYQSFLDCYCDDTDRLLDEKDIKESLIEFVISEGIATVKDNGSNNHKFQQVYTDVKQLINERKNRD